MNKRNTIQKQLVLHSVGTLGNHPTADDVYSQIAVSYPGISKATVYRNLNILVGEGLLQKIHVPGEADKYDHTIHAHYHAICSQCGKFTDLDLANPPLIDIASPEMKEFKIEEFVILFKGICEDCRKHETKISS